MIPSTLKVVMPWWVLANVGNVCIWPWSLSGEYIHGQYEGNILHDLKDLVLNPGAFQFTN